MKLFIVHNEFFSLRTHNGWVTGQWRKMENFFEKPMRKMIIEEKKNRTTREKFQLCKMKRRKIVRDNWYFVEKDVRANESERKLINDSLLIWWRRKWEWKAFIHTYKCDEHFLLKWQSKYVNRIKCCSKAIPTLRM